MQFPPTTSSALQAAFSERCERLMELPGLPVVATEALETMVSEGCVDLLQVFDEQKEAPNRREWGGFWEGSALPF